MDIYAKSQEFKVSLRDEISRALSNNSKETDEPRGFTGPGILFGDQPPLRNATEYLKSAVGWVYGCVSAIADAIAQVDIMLYQVDKNGDIKEVDSHPVIDVLERVNSHTTRFDHFWLSQQYLELVGEAPWYVDRGESGTQDPQNLILLRPDRLTIKQSKDPKSDSPVEKYIYKLELGAEMEIRPEEIIFLKYPDPLNAFRGKGTLQAAAMTFDIDQYAEDFNRRFFFNSARPDSVISTEHSLSLPQQQQLRSSIDRLYKGKNNAHKTLILEKGLEWKPMAITQKDMDFLEQQKFSRDKILSIFRVHKSILSLTDDVNLANAQVGETVFMKWTVKPKLVKMVAQLNEFFLPMFAGTENFFLSFPDPVPQNKEEDLKIYDSGLSKGWMTINEVRTLENLEPIGKEGDKIYLPSTMVPIDMAGQSGGLPPIKDYKRGIIERSGGGYARAFRYVKTVNTAMKKQKEAIKTIEKVEKKIDRIAFDMVKKNISDQAKKKHEGLVELGELFVKASDNWLGRYEKLIKDNFERQKKKVLAKMSTKAAINIDQYMLDQDDESQILIELTTPTTLDIIEQQGLRAAKLVGLSDFNSRTKLVQEFLKKNAIKLAGAVTEETLALLKNQLAKGVSEGEGIPALRKRVKNLFEGMQTYRADRIARSEVIRASNFAAQEAFKQSDRVKELEWLVTKDGRLCQFCATMMGKKIKLGGKFFKKGDSVTGTDGDELNLDYSNIEYPPLHPSCRCTIIPVI